MTTLAVTYLHLQFDLSNEELEQASNYLRGVAHKYASVVYRQDVDVRVEVKHGSIESWILVGGSVCLAIGQYGSFRSGVDQIIKDAKLVREYVVNTLAKDGVPEQKLIESKRMQCLPDKIRRFFLSIDRYEERLPRLGRREAKRELDLIVRAAGRVVDGLEYEQDLRQFLEGVHDRYQPSPERIALRHRLPMRREEDNLDGHSPAQQTHGLSVSLPPGGDLVFSANNSFQRKLGPPPSLLSQSRRRLRRR